MNKTPRLGSLLLHRLGEVAYLRFATVYKTFDSEGDFVSRTPPSGALLQGETVTDLNPEQTIETFTRIIEEEAAALAVLLPDAVERQWTTSPVPRPRDEESRGVVGAEHSDPTADVALDPRRMAVRETVLRSRLALRDAAVALRGVRVAMERNLRWYDGE